MDEYEICAMQPTEKFFIHDKNLQYQHAKTAGPDSKAARRSPIGPPSQRRRHDQLRIRERMT
jgi:hypothetical protein